MALCRPSRLSPGGLRRFSPGAFSPSPRPRPRSQSGRSPTGSPRALPPPRTLACMSSTIPHSIRAVTPRSPSTPPRLRPLRRTARTQGDGAPLDAEPTVDLDARVAPLAETGAPVAETGAPPTGEESGVPPVESAPPVSPAGPPSAPPSPPDELPAQLGEQVTSPGRDGRNTRQNLRFDSGTPAPPRSFSDGAGRPPSGTARSPRQCLKRSPPRRCSPGRPFRAGRRTGSDRRSGSRRPSRCPSDP